MIKIEKNIPFPPPGHRHNYPFDNLAVGESFLLEPRAKQSLPQLLAAMRAASKTGLRYQKGFTMRIVHEDDGLEKTHGVRCWRIK